jgi:oligopeptide/dipeptide ABC transporter ATP-binding protein
MALLEVADLRVSFSTPDGVLRAVRGVTFSVEPGRTLGVVGESGSGKSVSMQAIIGLSQGARVVGSAKFEGRELVGMAPGELRKIRGAQVAMIFQDPLSSLHPLYRVGWQIAETLRVHEKLGRRQARRRAIELLSLVGIPTPERRVDDYPHQFSGGMRQRAMIAMALALSPKLLIADEPTTALDVTVQAQIIELIRRLQSELGTAVIMITHDLGIVADIADDVMVMYAGKPMEHADKRTLYYRPHHPYTVGLIESLPQQGPVRERLRPIPGLPPSLLRVPTGCPFHPRCRHAMDRCRVEEPALVPVSGSSSHRSACWMPPEQIGLGSEREASRARVAQASGGAAANDVTITAVEADRR